MGNHLSHKERPFPRSYSEDFHRSSRNSVQHNSIPGHRNQSAGFHVTSADQAIHEDLSRLKFNMFAIDLKSRSKSLSSAHEIDNAQKTPSNTPVVQQRKSSSRSPFSIRRVKAVKPDKITMNNNNSGNLTPEVVKKRSSFLRRKSSQDLKTDQDSSMESRVRLKYVRTAPEFSKTYYKYREQKKPSVEFDEDTLEEFEYDPTDIERRRRRIRSIINTVPSPVISTKFRSQSDTSSMRTDDAMSVGSDDVMSVTSFEEKQEIQHGGNSNEAMKDNKKDKNDNSNGKDNTDSGNNRKDNTDSGNNRKDTDGIEVDSNTKDNIDDDNNNNNLNNGGENKDGENEKSVYSSITDRRMLWRGNRSDKTLNDVSKSPKHNKKTGSSSKTPENKQVADKVTGTAGENVEDGSDQSKQNDQTSKNPLNLTIQISDQNDEIDDMEGGSGLKRSSSMKSPKSATAAERKTSQPNPIRKPSNEGHEKLPDLLEPPKTPGNSMGRLKRDYHLTDTEIIALRGILQKADLYEQVVRERMFQVLKIDTDSEVNLEDIVSKVVSDKEIETLKQRLFMSRKELDSYISFTKKMEREKRQFQSEKEELETKIQWHERRLTRFESENKTLKTERANLMNQIYELRSKSSSIKETGHSRQKSLESSLSITEQSKLESSKQRFIHEADIFAQERSKLIKERQRLDEDNRKAHIRNVSLIAQVQHWEKTVKELEAEKEELKNRLAKMSRQSIDDQRKLLDNNSTDMTDSGLDVSDKDHNYNCLIETIKFDDSEITRLRKEIEDYEQKYENLKNDYRSMEENQITIDHENMALKDTVNVLQNAKEEADARLNEVDKKYHETLTDLKTITLSSEELEKDNIHLQKELEHVSINLSELQRDAVEMESDQDAFKKFLDKLSMELQEKLGEEHVSKDTEAESLQEQAEIIGRQVVAHLNPSRKVQEENEALKMDKEELEEELKFLKFALSNRMEIKSLQAPIKKCECSKENEALKRDYEDSLGRIESLEDEVTRLHQDKQQLLMSFLNLQASTRPRDSSKSEAATDDDLFDDGEMTETERESDYDTDIARSLGTNSHASSMSDIKIEDDDDKRSDTSLKRPSMRPPISEAKEDFRTKYEEAVKTIQRLESERIEMLNSLCHQAENNNTLKLELEDLRSTSERPGSRSSGSRPGSAIGKSESMVSITSEKCANCFNFGEEIRSYLSIIEELTEDKLQLEKQINDLELEKEKYENDLERMTDNFCKMESEMSIVDSEKENTVRSAKEEKVLLLRNVQSLREENTLLEENLQQLDEDRREVLQNLKQAEEDRLGFIRTIQLISEQKEAVEDQLDLLKTENEDLKGKLKEREGCVVSALSHLDLSKADEDDRDADFEDGETEPGCRETVEASSSVVQSFIATSTDTSSSQYSKFTGPALKMSRSVSNPAKENKTKTSSYDRMFSSEAKSPRLHSLRRTESFDDISEEDRDTLTTDKILDIDSLLKQVSVLKKEINSYKSENIDLNKSLSYANSLLREEKKYNRRLLSERCISPVSSSTTSEKKAVVEDNISSEAVGQLETISELRGSASSSINSFRRLSLEQLRSGSNEDVSPRLRPNSERRSSLVDEEIAQRKKMYGQRKASMTLDEMLDLFGVHTSIQASASSSDCGEPKSPRTPSSAKTLSFEVSKNGIPIHSQKEF